PPQLTSLFYLGSYVRFNYTDLFSLFSFLFFFLISLPFISGILLHLTLLLPPVKAHQSCCFFLLPHNCEQPLQSRIHLLFHPIICLIYCQQLQPTTANSSQLTALCISSSATVTYCF